MWLQYRIVEAVCCDRDRAASIFGRIMFNPFDITDIHPSFTRADWSWGGGGEGGGGEEQVSVNHVV